MPGGCLLQRIWPVCRKRLLCGRLLLPDECKCHIPDAKCISLPARKQLRCGLGGSCPVSHRILPGPASAELLQAVPIWLELPHQRHGNPNCLSGWILLPAGIRRTTVPCRDIWKSVVADVCQPVPPLSAGLVLHIICAGAGFSLVRRRLCVLWPRDGCQPHRWRHWPAMPGWILLPGRKRGDGSMPTGGLLCYGGSELAHRAVQSWLLLLEHQRCTYAAPVSGWILLSHRKFVATGVPVGHFFSCVGQPAGRRLRDMHSRLCMHHDRPLDAGPRLFSRLLLSVRLGASQLQLLCLPAGRLLPRRLVGACRLSVGQLPEHHWPELMPRVPTLLLLRR